MFFLARVSTLIIYFFAFGDGEVHVVDRGGVPDKLFDRRFQELKIAWDFLCRIQV